MTSRSTRTKTSQRHRTSQRSKPSETKLRELRQLSFARSGWWLLGIAGLAGAIVASIMSEARGSDTGRAIVVIPVIVGLMWPIISKARKMESEFDLGGILFAGLGVKMMAVYGRFQMVDELYSGSGDSSTYHVYGAQFAPSFRQLNFDVDPGLPIPGTGFVRVLTGVVYAIFGSDRYTGFLIFGVLGFLGSWFFYRAFALALPDGNRSWYAKLVFFWPTLIFWPSAIGKEGWMIFSLGLTSWGAAALYRRHLSKGFPLLALGVLGTTMPRPHIAIVVLVAVFTGLVMGSLFRSEDSAKSLGFFSKVATAVFLLVLGSLLAPRVAQFLNIDDVGGSGFTETLDEVARRTSQGGSNFTPAEINTPLDYPWAFLTVLFRPFPFEVSNLQSAMSSMEGVVLGLLMLGSLRQILTLPIRLVKNPYVAYAFAFAFMFIYVFAFVGNFGILARQRSQLLPFVFVLISITPPRKKRRRSFDTELTDFGERPDLRAASSDTIDVRQPTVDLRPQQIPALSPPRARR